MRGRLRGGQRGRRARRPTRGVTHVPPLLAEAQEVRAVALVRRQGRPARLLDRREAVVVPRELDVPELLLRDRLRRRVELGEGFVADVGLDHRELGIRGDGGEGEGHGEGRRGGGC